MRFEIVDGSGWGMAMALAASVGCSDASGPVPEPSTCAYEVGGACVGLPATGCTADGCAAQVACATTTPVGDDAALTAAAGAAKPGECILLAPGSFAAVSLPGGASLIGAGFDQSTVAAVEIAAGSGSVVKGLTVGAGGVK